MEKLHREREAEREKERERERERERANKQDGIESFTRTSILVRSTTSRNQLTYEQFDLHMSSFFETIFPRCVFVLL